VVQGGRVQGYFLSSYSARKLGMKTTGNAGGSHNLVLTSRLTQPATTSTPCCKSWAPACLWSS
jgi:PmbA protein